ncbi:Mu transposase C-terminal domain-containing protein [Permianibacter aggregans]|uniref:Putative transposase n=1 Tax=Permianibacter aggregans TaxID=1510150 RepID=A0A4R6US25_9GAMM|nr:Mu transposase C-terminal domain-containing protein [Permianibacter aggregans]QGX40148.1 transposase [Permianibacter aggregans]TDQ49036.1 putative transposase [Permianibacter aggregans]
MASLTPLFGSLEPGATIYVEDRRYVLVTLLDFQDALIRHPQSGNVTRVPVRDIAFFPKEEEKRHIPELLNVLDKNWEEASRRFDCIKPLVEFGKNASMAEIKSRAAEVDIPYTTLYRWIRQYRDTGQMAGLLRQTRTDKGTKRLSNEQEKIVEESIKKHRMTVQRKKTSKVIEDVKKVCRAAGLAVPHANTIRARVNDFSLREVYEAQYGKKAAREKYDLYRGKYDEATYPLKIIQIDHTPMDICVVDSQSREPIGTPFLTMAIDVYSRMVCGFYISLDAPSANSVGMCVSHMMLPKDEFLAKHNISTSWDVWGKPDCIHVDNGKDFRSNTLQRACEQYGIDLQYRPLGRPNFGGHIEALLGTIMKELHSLPGTKFSNVAERANYDTEGRACLTVPELEKWVTHFIVEVYHQRKHSALYGSPAQKFKDGIFGTGTTPGRGVATRPLNEAQLRLDFLPVFYRTVQAYGILLDHIFYYHEILQRWVGEQNPSPAAVDGKFVVRRDPRDISEIYFFDPSTGQYHRIPYRDLSHPAVNIWEFEAARKFAIERGAKLINEDIIFSAYDEMERIVENARKQTKKVRRDNERKAEHKRQPSIKMLLSDESKGHERTREPERETKPLLDIKPFDIDE